jgi:hypothetical protein
MLGEGPAADPRTGGVTCGGGAIDPARALPHVLQLKSYEQLDSKQAVRET